MRTRVNKTRTAGVNIFAQGNRLQVWVDVFDRAKTGTSFLRQKISGRGGHGLVPFENDAFVLKGPLTPDLIRRKNCCVPQGMLQVNEVVSQEGRCDNSHSGPAGPGRPGCVGPTTRTCLAAIVRIGPAVIDTVASITGRSLVDSARKVVIYLSSTALVTTTVGTMLSDGTILTSQSTVSGSYPTSISYVASQSTESVFVSPTGAYRRQHAASRGLRVEVRSALTF